MEDSTPPARKRRPRYKGKHPRRFEEKYKEHNPEKYSGDAKKIEARGATLAGTHRPICVDEILEILKPEPGLRALDLTMGYGGHGQALIEALSPGGTYIGIDQDSLERPKTIERLSALKKETKLLFGPINFRKAEGFLKEIGKVDLVLADLGVSSMQIDNPKRGFSFKVNSDFDLRMNPEKGVPAFELFKSLSESDLREILAEYADEPHARQMAEALKQAQPKTTFQVAEVVRAVVAGFSAKIRAKEGDTPIRRVFQALRIAVNEEFEALDEMLEFLPRILAPKGRVAILSFHSGEDRRVKKSFQKNFRESVYSEISEEALRPSLQEQNSNPRSKSAKLRWARR